MPKWNTRSIEKAFSDLGPISVSGQGGSYDTETVHISPNGLSNDDIRITGFTPGSEVKDPYEVEEVVEVVVRNCHSDSRGGLQTNDENLGAIYGRVVARLTKMGFAVYNNYDEFF